MLSRLRWLTGLLLTSSVLVLSSSIAAAAAPSPSWQSPLRPVVVTRPFQPPPGPYAAGHRGVDLAGLPGQRVLAAADGVVSFAGMLAGRGVIAIDHGSLRTTYEPVSPRVGRGSGVHAGDVIAVLEAGHAGCPAAACLHWGLLSGTRYLDPMTRLSARPVRLLPAVGLEPAADVVSSAAAGPVLGAGGGPSPTTWSLVAVAGLGAVVGRRYR